MPFDRRAIRHQRKQESDLKGANKVLEAMRAENLALFVTHLANSRSWQLSNGVSVPAAVAEIVTVDPNIIGVGDALFGDRHLSQSFQYLEPEEAPAD